MSSAATERSAGRAGTSTDLDAAQVWSLIRTPLALVLVIVAIGAGVGWLNSRQQHGLLDPRAYDLAGSRAVAELLRAEGVSVDLVRTTEEAVASAGAGTTLLVVFPQLLQQPQLDALAGARTERMVLVGPSEESLATLAPDVTVAGDAPLEPREPGCQLPAARRAGDADAGGVLFEVKPGAEPSGTALCYAAEGNPSLISMPVRGREVVLLGGPSPLLNEKLDERGNAALAMNLLGQHDRLVWYLPSLGDSLATEQRSPYDLIPAGWKWGFAQAGIAVLLLALWRIRRLGPVVAEPLPVVVRGAETVEGRARLYRRARARDRAAETLRAASRERLAPLVGIPVFGSPHALVDAVAARVGRSAQDVGRLLYGSIPADDATLVRLADDLDALESEVRRS